MREITVRAPATVSNVVCGFDCLGFALQEPFDLVTLREIPEKNIRIVCRSGHDVPTDPEKNVAGVALSAIMGVAGVTGGFEIELVKNIKPGSGIGSSAASACGTVAAANILLDNRFSKSELVGFAMEGERLASGERHADNAAPCIFGGFTLVRSIEPLDVVPLGFPELFATVIHPQIEIKTSEARAILPKDVPLRSAISQWSNVGGMVSALASGDYALLARSMTDGIIEPVRKSLIPEFDNVKMAAQQAGALGGGISGSGPSIFMLSETEAAAYAVELAIRKVYSRTGIEFRTYVSAISESGVTVL
jgi:homoserine kinase